MGIPIRVLIVEDSEDDMILILRELQQNGYDPIHQRVETPQAMQAALAEESWNLVITDHTMPHFSGKEALALLRKTGRDLPLIVVSGSIGEETAVEMMREGATDYLIKNNLKRLGPTVQRTMQEAVEKRERKQAQAALAEQAIRDPLTGLYNRRYFNVRITEEIARAARYQQSLIVLLCDLDHFKTVNDTQGHLSGDEVLKAVAKSIQEATRGTDLVFRWGGDEFIVLLSNTSREGIIIVADRIRDKVLKLCDIYKITLDLSIGVAFHPEHGRNADDLIRVADLALYIAKRGGDKVQIGTDEYHLDEHSIKVVFQPLVATQPIMNIRTQKAVGYEALSRDPEGKLSIFELFRKYKAIGKLQELKCICFKTQLKKAQEVGLERVFINVDFNVLSQVELVPRPLSMEVILEISELEAIHDVESRLQIAKKWREQGYKFAIDDFGAGFISFPFIARLVPEYIKIDRSTMLQAVSSEQFKEFLIGVIFGLKNYASEGIIAEGVETEKELQVVKDLGIFIVQGFLFGKPQELK